VLLALFGFVNHNPPKTTLGVCRYQSRAFSGLLYRDILNLPCQIRPSTPFPSFVCSSVIKRCIRPTIETHQAIEPYTRNCSQSHGNTSCSILCDVSLFAKLHTSASLCCRLSWRSRGLPGRAGASCKPRPLTSSEGTKSCLLCTPTSLIPPATLVSSRPAIVEFHWKCSGAKRKKGPA